MRNSHISRSFTPITFLPPAAIMRRRKALGVIAGVPRSELAAAGEPRDRSTGDSQPDSGSSKDKQGTGELVTTSSGASTQSPDPPPQGPKPQ